MEKRFQVFVSSTFQDLQEERQEVMHALLELDCIPSGMELFPAANETQWELIKRVIDDCDYYILIIGGRYGTIGPSGLSYTEMEYDYAVSSGKPTVAFLHKDPETITVKKSENLPDGKEKLVKFRIKVEKKLCKHWASPIELGSVVSRSLIQLIKREPAIGWVRANSLADKDATMELLRLRNLVDELKEELTANRVSAPEGTQNLAQGTEMFKITFKFTAYFKRYMPSEYKAELQVSWNSIFAWVSPLMIHEASSHQVSRALNNLCEQRHINILRGIEKFKGITIENFFVDLDDFQTILVQLRALGLIAKSVKNRSVKDTDTYWTLTAYGDEVMTRLRAIRKDDSDLDFFDDNDNAADVDDDDAEQDEFESADEDEDQSIVDSDS